MNSSTWATKDKLTPPVAADVEEAREHLTDGLCCTQSGITTSVNVDSLRILLLDHARLTVKNATQFERIKRLEEAFAQVLRHAENARVWGGDHWTYYGLSERLQKRVIGLCYAALKEDRRG